MEISTITFDGKEYTTALTDNINKPSMITNLKLVRRRVSMGK